MKYKFKIGDEVIFYKKIKGIPDLEDNFNEATKSVFMKKGKIINRNISPYWNNKIIYFVKFKTNIICNYDLIEEQLKYAKPILKKFIEEMEKKDEIKV